MVISPGLAALGGAFKRLIVVFLLCTIPLSVGTAQDVPTDASGSVFAPFVSRIRISIRDPEVRISWQDSEDVEGTYRIYRHTSEITADTFLVSELVAQVEAGVESYIDAPEAPGDYYYAVIAAAPTGESYEVFIPYRNTTSNPVSIANIATLEEQAARVRSLTANVEEMTVLLDYESDSVGRELIIYRSTDPFSSAEGLAFAGVVATVASGVESVVDYPVPGVPYYYAVIDSELAANGMVGFEPGQNTLAEPVEIPLLIADSASAPASPGSTTDAPASADLDIFTPAVVRRRPLPLPFLQLTTDLETGIRIGDTDIIIPSEQPVARETAQAVAAMVSRLPPLSTKMPEPRILDEDQLPSPRGSEYTLRTILDGPFSAMAWEEAINQLNIMLSLPLDDAVRSRAVFYRAQSFLFSGDPERAFLEFLLARDDHYQEVQEWLDSILSSPSGA